MLAMINSRTAYFPTLSSCTVASVFTALWCHRGSRRGNNETQSRSRGDDRDYEPATAESDDGKDEVAYGSETK